MQNNFGLNPLLGKYTRQMEVGSNNTGLQVGHVRLAIFLPDLWLSNVSSTEKKWKGHPGVFQAYEIRELVQDRTILEST